MLAYWWQVGGCPVPPLGLSWAAGGSWDVIPHFTLECPPLHPPAPAGSSAPSSVHTPVVWELLMFVGVSVSAVEQVFAVPFSQAGVHCSAVVLFPVMGRGEGLGRP